MNCREAERHIFAERDGTLDPGQRSALADHVAACPACRRINDGLSETVGIWKAQVQAVAIPDAEREWHDLRRRMRQETATSGDRRPHWTAWIGAPLAGAAALAVVVALNTRESEPPAPTAPRTLARAEYVEVPSANASTVVFVDDKSGWLVVLASDAPRPF